jgi:hypothetical protein
LRVPSRLMNKRGVGFFFIWTMRCVGGLARSDNDNVGSGGQKVRRRIVQPGYSSSTVETK